MQSAGRVRNAGPVTTLEEILSLSDRVLVLFEGRIVGEFAPGASKEELGIAMTGGRGEATAT